MGQFTTIWRNSLQLSGGKARIYLTEELASVWRNRSQPFDGTAHNYLVEQLTTI
jgi:hypothetical protein